MTGITMYDTAFNDQFPAGAAAYAAYVDGSDGNQPNYAYIVSTFPKAQHLSIALFSEDNADALDVEPGAATPADIPGWYARQVARGVQRPVIYANVSTMESAVIPVIDALPGTRDGVRLWTAHYGAGEHICGPATCRALSTDADGTQWTSSALGRTLDQSLLAADFFGTPAPVPAQTWEDKLMATITTVQTGSKDVQAVKNWQGLLIARGYDLGITGTRGDGVDGDFGAATETATKDFQATAKISVDGEGRAADVDGGTGLVSLAYVTITGSFADGTGAGSAVTGTASFEPTATVYSAGTPFVVPELPVQALITAGQLQALDGSPVQLLATDNDVEIEGPSPEWLWCAKVEITAGGSTAEDSWEFALPSSPATTDLYATRNPA